MNLAPNVKMSQTNSPSPAPLQPRPSLLAALSPPDDPTKQFNRLSLPFPTRLTLASLTASFSGFALGAAKGMKDSELRFRAENAHRLPTTTTGWYLYHKSKNYNALLGGIKEGARMAGRLTVWAGVFFAVEEGVDRGRARIVRIYRNTLGAPRPSTFNTLEEEEEEEDAPRLSQIAGNRDFLSTGFAGLGTGGVFAAWYRMPLPTATRLMKMGLKYGLLWGLVQDVVNVIKGRRVGYVEFGKGVLGGRRDVGEEEQGREVVEAKG